MDYRFFEQLAVAEAEVYLVTFLEEERKRIPPAWWDRLMADGVGAIEPYFAEFAPKIGLVRVAPPEDLPEYIVKSMERDHGVSVSSRRMRIGSLSSLLPSISARRFSEATRRCRGPWVAQTVPKKGSRWWTGFSSDADLPVLEVAENLALEYERDPSRVATAIATWRRVV